MTNDSSRADGARAYHLTDEMRRTISPPQFPRAAQYDPHWVLDNEMGPNVLWLAEWASEVLKLEPGMRVLDLGCGKALSSVFLAREFGVAVTAADLWIRPTENWRRIEEAELADRVFPIHAEAHALPFADGYFDAILSFDAYQYFGTDDLYLGTITRFLRPGGQLGIVVPSLARELSDGPPEALRDFWEWEFACFHTADWWRSHWQRTGLVDVELADNLSDGWRLWPTGAMSARCAGSGWKAARRRHGKPRCSALMPATCSASPG